MHKCAKARKRLASSPPLFPLKAAKRKGFLDHGMAREAVAVEHAFSLVRVRPFALCAAMRQMEGSFAVVIASARWFARAVWTFDKWEGLMRGWQVKWLLSWDPKRLGHAFLSTQSTCFTNSDVKSFGG